MPVSFRRPFKVWRGPVLDHYASSIEEALMGQDTWEGGYVRHDAKGRDVYVIRRMVGGKRYKVSTRCHDEPQAVIQLRRFEENPDAYSPRGKGVKEPVPFDDELVLAFLTHSRDEAENCAEWVHQQKIHLQWWQEQLGKGADLRRVDLARDVLPALDGAKSRAHRVAVLKRLYSWLVSVARKLEPAEDPTYRKLAATKAKPGPDCSFPAEHFQKALAQMVGQWRDLLIVSGGTGMHMTELRRFADGGKVEPLPAGREDGAAQLVVPYHKNGKLYRVAVSQPVKEAAERVLARGSFSIRRFAEKVREACQLAKVPPFTPGRALRHTVATVAVNAGRSVQATGEYLGHNDVKTTRIYAQNAPPKVPTLA